MICLDFKIGQVDFLACLPRFFAGAFSAASDAAARFLLAEAEAEVDFEPPRVVAILMASVVCLRSQWWCNWRKQC